MGLSIINRNIIYVGESMVDWVITEVGNPKRYVPKYRRCVQWKTVYSKALGKYVRRCAKYEPLR